MTSQPAVRPNQDQIRLIIERAVSWLTNAQEPSGHFRYEYLPYDGTYRDDDNIVRQAGALYGLGEVAKRDTHNKYDLKPVIIRSIDYFEDISNAATYNGRRFRAVCTDPIKRKHKLGASSLVLCGILAAAERYPELSETYKALIHDYKEFIVAMKKDGQNEGAGFISAYILDAKAQKPVESSYSTGEAMLALARYHRYASPRGLLKPDDPVEDIVKETFSYINSPAQPFDTALYLWAMAALPDLSRLDAKRTADHVDYARRYTLWRINSVKDKKASRHNFASAAEGMISAYTFIQSTSEAAALQPFTAKLNLEINYWLAHSAIMQLKQDDTARFSRVSDAQRANGGFLTGLREPTQRIDFTQHALMAYIQKLSDIDGQSL